MPSDDARDLSRLSVMVVDDEAVSRGVAVKTLSGLGVSRILRAAGGVEALDILASGEPQPDVLLVDINMPEMGGVELMRRLGESGYGGAVIVLSGLAEETLEVSESLARTRHVNVLGHIKKPITAADLVELLENLA